MKTNLVLQFQGREQSEESMIRSAEEAWKNAGNKVSDIKSIQLFPQPENSVCYYVINKDFDGSFGI
ncbi:MAG: hypothetical protein IK139_06475 [Lachnospiraceae bacterium]|nr:hypothetical protein [Lachnospiraceae bacterium]